MVATFTRQLYSLMKAGIPLLRSLQIVHTQQSPGKFKSQLEMIIQSVQEGKSFSESLSYFPKEFSLFYVNMIKAAEASGNLTGILKQVSEYLMQVKRITKQIQTALMYPLFVLIIAVAILTALTIFVFPVFMKIFEDLGGELPPITLFLIKMDKFILRWGWLFILAGIILAAAAFFFSKKPTGARIMNNLRWHLPLFGKIIKLIEIGRFCRTIGTLLSSGVTLIKSLDVLIETTPTVLLREAIEDIRFKVEGGQNLSGAMEETGIFPLVLVKTISVGEETGKIAELFLDTAEDFEADASFSVTGLLSLLEPFLIVVMGGIVGFIVISLFFPIITMTSLVK